MIHNPNMSAPVNWTASCVITGHLVTDIWVSMEFKTGYNALLMQEGCGEIMFRNVKNEHAVLVASISAPPPPALDAC